MIIIFTLELYFNISWARLINNSEKYSQEILVLHHLIYLERLYYLQNAFIQLYFFTNAVPELIQYLQNVVCAMEELKVDVYLYELILLIFKPPESDIIFTASD